MLPWLTGPWVIDGVAGVVLLLGVAAAAWGLWGDRSKGIPRCPKCWYDLRGQPPERRLTCPECGHTAHHERRLYRHHRRWWPVVLGLILFVLPSAGVLYVVVGWQRERAALAAIKPHLETPSPYHYHMTWDWVGPKWLLPYVPVSLHRYGERVVNVKSGLKFDDADMMQLAGLTNLTMVDIVGSRVTDEGLVHLSGLTRLELLSLVGVRATDRGLTHLYGLTNLKRVHLNYTLVTAAGAAELQKHLPNTEIEY